MKKLYKPENEMELSLIKSIFESEGIHYFVLNDHFGSLHIGPQIDLYNARIFMVPEEQFTKAEELIAGYINNTREESSEPFKSQYSIAEKIRITVEGILFGWVVPRKRKRTHQSDGL
ncbi:MAG: DUF2007 domain-containing protein [Desulfobacterales bacterium]|nr:DUF2007 domain-containing protein [Desulfobacterales bacterium]